MGGRLFVRVHTTLPSDDRDEVKRLVIQRFAAMDIF